MSTSETSPHGRWYALEMVLFVAFISALIAVGFWRILCDYMAAVAGLSDPPLPNEPVADDIGTALLLVVLIALIRILPRRLLLVLWRNGHVKPEDFTPFRRSLEQPLWFAGAIVLVAVGLVWMCVREQWSAMPMLLWLPMIALLQVRRFLALPEATDPRNSLTTPGKRP